MNESPSVGMSEAPVFVAEHPWRRRGLRAGVVGSGVLLAAWLLAVVIGALGFTSLPGVPFDRGGGSPPQAAATPRPKPATPGRAAKHRKATAASGRTAAT